MNVPDRGLQKMARVAGGKQSNCPVGAALLNSYMPEIAPMIQ